MKIFVVEEHDELISTIMSAFDNEEDAEKDASMLKKIAKHGEEYFVIETELYQRCDSAD